MQLVLLRHGPAEERNPSRWPDDDDRPLSNEGTKETHEAMRGLRRTGLTVGRLVSSPAVRARATADVLRVEFGVPSKPAEWPELAPGAPAAALLERVGRTPPAQGALVAVGHEPTLGELVGLALCGEAISVVRLGRAGAALVEFSGRVTPSGGELVWLMNRRQLARLRA